MKVIIICYIYPIHFFSEAVNIYNIAELVFRTVTCKNKGMFPQTDTSNDLVPAFPVPEES